MAGVEARFLDAMMARYLSTGAEGAKFAASLLGRRVIRVTSIELSQIEKHAADDLAIRATVQERRDLILMRLY